MRPYKTRAEASHVSEFGIGQPFTLPRSLTSSPAAGSKGFCCSRTETGEEQATEAEEQEDLASVRLLIQLTWNSRPTRYPKPRWNWVTVILKIVTAAALREFARRAEALKAENDPKIAKAADLLVPLIKKCFHPIVYCRFIPTAQYVADELNRRLSQHWKDFRAVAVTGASGSDERT